MAGTEAKYSMELLQEAERGNPAAQYAVGLCCETGAGIARDYTAAERWYRRAIANDNYDAMVNLAKLIRSANLRESVALVARAAACGHARAQYELSQYYATGLVTGVRNSIMATYWLKHSADQGFADARFELGVAYDDGIGVVVDHAAAARMYRLAAEQGHAKAQYNLGVCYEQGEGTARNCENATIWFRRASDQGHAEAQYNLGRCYSYGRGVPEDRSEAARLFQLSASQGCDVARVALGRCMWHGVGVPVDRDGAVHITRIAADHGLLTAQAALGFYLMKSGDSCSEMAVHWLKLAAGRGNASAQTDLARCYDTSFGVAQDHVKSAQLYHLAAEQGEMVAQYNLGVAYEDGEGVECDLAEAVRWYGRAAAQGDERAREKVNKCKSLLEPASKRREVTVDDVGDPDGKDACCVCMHSRRCMVIMECGHLCLCAACSERLTAMGDAKCPLCRTQIIHEMKKVFF